MKTIFISANWQKGELSDPCLTITDFFADESLYIRKEIITDILKCAFSYNKIGIDKKWLMHQFRMLESAIIAAWQINQEDRENPVIIELNDFMLPAHFTTRTLPYSQWRDIPRTLTDYEFVDPYETIACFFEHHDLKTWRIILKKIWRRSNSKKCFQRDSPFIEYFILHSYLLKLTEALHLIYVREIFPAAGIPDPDLDDFETAEEVLPPDTDALETEHPAVTKPDTCV